MGWDSGENPLYNIRLKSKITKILNSMENSKRKIPNQMAKSNAQTHQMNGQPLSQFWLGTAGIFLCRKWWTKPRTIAIHTSYLLKKKLKYNKLKVFETEELSWKCIINKRSRKFWGTMNVLIVYRYRKCGVSANETTLHPNNNL